MKEQVTKFNLQDAFKALEEIETPKVKGIKPNKDDHKELRESMRPTPKTDCLLEDYYDVQDQGDLQAAQADRQEEVAQAKLAKIEKIVDLDADSPEDLDPSYVGKTIVRCPQCMTLFYRNPEDLNASDEDKNIVNVGEVCPNCGNDSGYELVGKVAEVEPEETPNYENTNELDLNFEEPSEEGGEELPAEEPAAEEPAAEEAPAETPELDSVPTEEAPAEENVEEEKPEEEKKEEAFEAHSGNILAEQVENALKEDVDADALNKKLQEHNDYIKVLQDEIKAEEEAVKNAKNDFIKKMHENNLASLKDALDKAIPEEVKAEAAVAELPTAEDAAKDLTKNESLTEGSANELINELQKLDGYKGLSGTSLKKLLELYKDDMSGDPAFRLKNATVQDVTDWVGDFAEFLDTFADDIDMKFAKDIATNCPKVVKACRKAYKEANKEEAPSDEEAIDFIFEYSQEEGAKNDMTAREAVDAIDLTEALQEAAEKFPDPAKHELVDTVDGVEIYHCKNCGKYGAKINGKVVKKNSVEEIKNCINGKCESLKEELIDVSKEIKAIKDHNNGTVDAAIKARCSKIVGDKCYADAHNAKFIQDAASSFLKEEICPKCGKDVEDPCETPREAEYCRNNLEEDAVAKKAPKEGDDIELNQRKVSEIHKGKEEHVPGSIVEESANLKEASVESALRAFEAGLDESANSDNLKEDAEVEQKLADFENQIVNEAAETKPHFDFDIPEATDANFGEMINDPTFKSFGESVETGLNEELPIEAVSALGDKTVNELNSLQGQYADEIAKIEEENVAEPEVEELNDSYINSVVSNYLTEVYSNVNDFVATGCSINGDKLVLEGVINFKSGNTKDTKFTFTKAGKNTYKGVNESLATDGEFILEYVTEGGGIELLAEKLSYKYHIGENLIEGLATRK